LFLIFQFSFSIFFLIFCVQINIPKLIIISSTDIKRKLFPLQERKKLTRINFNNWI
jgi:hypothetical protein